jgi:hypothetical protein
MVISKSNHVKPKNRQRAPFFDQDTSLPTLKAAIVSYAFVFHFLDPQPWGLDRFGIAKKRLKIHEKIAPPPATLYTLLFQKNLPIIPMFVS